jgi:hypothetical protein
MEWGVRGEGEREIEIERERERERERKKESSRWKGCGSEMAGSEIEHLSIFISANQ